MIDEQTIVHARALVASLEAGIIWIVCRLLMKIIYLEK